MALWAFAFPSRLFLFVWGVVAVVVFANISPFSSILPPNWAYFKGLEVFINTFNTGCKLIPVHTWKGSCNIFQHHSPPTVYCPLYNAHPLSFLILLDVWNHCTPIHNPVLEMLLFPQARTTPTCPLLDTCELDLGECNRNWKTFHLPQEFGVGAGRFGRLDIGAEQMIWEESARKATRRGVKAPLENSHKDGRPARCWWPVQGGERRRDRQENCLELVFPILKFSWVPWGPVCLQ